MSVKERSWFKFDAEKVWRLITDCDIAAVEEFLSLEGSCFGRFAGYFIHSVPLVGSCSFVCFGRCYK